MRSVASAFQVGDVLYGRLRPYLNKVWFAECAGACSGELLVLRPGGNLLGRYLALVLHGGHFVSFASQAVTGDRPRLDFAEMANFPVPVPPLAVQRLIIDRVEELFNEIADGERALASARDAVATHRMSAEKALLEGAFLDDRSPTQTEERVAELLAEVKAHRRKAGREHPLLSELKLPSLPDGWRWVRLDELIHEGPTNGYSPKASHGATGTRSLKLTATSGGAIRLDADCVKTLNETIPPGSSLFLRPGDILFQRGNTRELVGIAAIYDGPSETYVYPDLMIRVRSPTRLLSRWIWRWANSPRGRVYMMENAQGAAGTMPKISGETVRMMPVPIGPPEEMTAILERLDTGCAAELTTVLADAQGFAQHLRQSILAAAFRGDLIA